jgi:hypothetical protein
MEYCVGYGYEQGYTAGALSHQEAFKSEMSRALSCISPASKRKLAAEWQSKYSELFYKELISCAKNKDAMREIANWDVENMR